MLRSISVERLSSDWSEHEYDLAIAAVGYERRARYIFETYTINARIKAAAGFPKQQVFEFQENSNWFEANGFAVVTVSDHDYGSWLASRIALAPSISGRADKDSIHLIIDISSLSRVRIADIITTLRSSVVHHEIVVDFVYSLAAFTPPPSNQSPNTHVGPVSKAFAGWWEEPDRLLSAVVGIGYEQDKALGAVEYLQAQDVWLFQPESVEKQYTSALNLANEALLKTIDSRHHFSYRVHDPMDCFSRLRSLVDGLAIKSNVVLLPFGPKLFVLCSLLVAAGRDQIAVWRVSAQTDEEPVNRIGSGHCYGLTVRFQAPIAND